MYNRNPQIPQEPQPAVRVLAFNESECHGKNLIVPIRRYCSQYLALVHSSQECAIHAQDWTAVPECIDVWTKDEECPLQYPLIGLFRIRGFLKVNMSAGIPVLYDSELLGEVVVRILERAEP